MAGSARPQARTQPAPQAQRRPLCGANPVWPQAGLVAQSTPVRPCGLQFTKLPLSMESPGQIEWVAAPPLRASS